MTEKKYKVHDWVKFDYSEIGEYIDENHTDKPLRNDEIVDLLNSLSEENELLAEICENLVNADARREYKLRERITEIEKENEQLKQVSQDYEDNVYNWFIENWNKLDDEQKQYAHLELGIDIDYDGDVE